MTPHTSFTVMSRSLLVDNDLVTVKVFRGVMEAGNWLGL